MRLQCHQISERYGFKRIVLVKFNDHFVGVRFSIRGVDDARLPDSTMIYGVDLNSGPDLQHTISFF